MPFGLTNTPRKFMYLMNEVLEELFCMFIIIYLDDIIIFSKTREEHITHIRHVLQWMREEWLSINIKKCSFMKNELVYLGFVISMEGLKMDPKR